MRRLLSRHVLAALMRAEDVRSVELARVAGVSPATISHLLTGRMPACADGVAVAIAERLDVPVGSLFAAPTASTTGGVRARAERVA